MKKISKYLLFILITLFLSINVYHAQELNLQELSQLVSEEVENVNAYYVIGKYVFTDSYVKTNSLSTQDIMLAARSIKADVSDGEVKSAEIYNKMNIYTVSKYTTGWKFSTNLIGKNKPDDDAILDIEYIDYNKIKNIYTVTFVDNEKNTTERVYEGEKVSSIDPESFTGHEFKGWYQCKNDDCSILEETPFDFDKEITTSIKLKAKWEPVSYTITFEDDNVSEKEYSYTYPNITPSDKEHFAPSNKDGYTFLYWYDEKDSESNPFDFSQELTSNVTLKAKWKINEYTVTFKDYDGDTTKKVEYNKQVEMPTSKDRKYYNFIGWYQCDDSECLTTSQNSFDFETNITEDIVLIAKWEEIKYSVTLKGQFLEYSGVKFEVLASNPYLTSETIKGINTNIEGHDFEGWYICDDDTCSTYSIPFDVDTTKITKDITIIAVWEIQSHTVTFKNYDGTIYRSLLVEHGKKVEDVGEVDRPNSSPYNGYKFTGWYLCSDEECSSAESLFNFTETSINNNITLIAKYEPVVYTNEIMSDFVENFNSKDFSSYMTENTKITFNVINKSVLLSVNYEKFVEELTKIMQVENVSSLTVQYAGKNVTLTEENISSEFKTVFETLTTKPFENATILDLIDKEFSITINLEDGYTDLNHNSTDKYELVIISDQYEPVYGESGLEAALKGDKEIIIMNSFTVNKKLEINRDVIIDGNNNTLTSNITDSKYFFVINSGTVTFKDLTLKIATLKPSEYNEDEMRPTVTKNTIGIYVGENASLTVTNVNVISDDVIDYDNLMLSGEALHTYNISVNENAAIELHGSLYGSTLKYQNELYGSPTILMSGDKALMKLGGFHVLSSVYNIKRNSVGDSYGNKITTFTHYYSNYNNTIVSFVWYVPTSGYLNYFTYLYNEKLLIPESFNNPGHKNNTYYDTRYNKTYKYNGTWRLKDSNDLYTSEQVLEFRATSKEGYYFYAQYNIS